MNTIGPNSSNPAFLSAQRTHQQNQRSMVNSLEKLSTGQRINRGSDDPAGLITSENLRSVLAALDADSRRLERADMVAATADAALSEMGDMLIEAEAMVIANANTAGMSAEEQAANQMEIDSIVSTVNRLAQTTTFNGDKLLDGTASLNANGETLDIDQVSVAPVGEGADALAALSEARNQISTMRGKLGAFSKHTIGSSLNQIAAEIENLSRAESMIRDTDYAAETAELARLGVLTDASIKAMSLTGNAQGRVLDLLA